MIIEAGSTTASLTQNALVAGSTVLILSALGEGKRGYVDIRSQLTSSHKWLLGDYDGDGSYDDDPLGRASFGLFKGSDNILFRRELY
jgi:MSHA biogenesis protein MshQ